MHTGRHTESEEFIFEYEISNKMFRNNKICAFLPSKFDLCPQKLNESEVLSLPIDPPNMKMIQDANWTQLREYLISYDVQCGQHMKAEKQ